MSNNSALQFGGGINNWQGLLTLMNSTVSQNSAGIGRGIYNFAGAATVTNTLVDGDCAADFVAPTTSNGYNIESPGDTCSFDRLTDQVDITEAQLKLGPLQDNGGPTMTHALEAGSEAIDKIPEAACGVDTDQRGKPRPETGGTMCDVGAFEVQGGTGGMPGTGGAGGG